VEDVPRVVIVVAAVVVATIVVVDVIVVDPSLSITFSEDDPVPFIGSSRQHRMLDVGHWTSSRTSSHIKVASACTHTPGQSAIFAVLVNEFKNPTCRKCTR